MNKTFAARAIPLIFAVLFLPTLTAVILLGDRLDYSETCRLVTLVDNKILFLLGLAALGIIAVVYHFFPKKELTARGNLLMDFTLAAAFTGLYFVNMAVSRHIVFYTGWDPDVVRGGAYGLLSGTGLYTNYYYDIYQNNVFIVYLLYRLLNFAQNAGGELTQNGDMIWIQTTCALICLAGFCTCLAVKRLTKSLYMTLITLALFAVSVSFTPWKIIPYTDMFAILFPILILCLYVYHETVKNRYLKLVLFAAILISGIFGSFIKPTVVIALIAVGILEIWKLIHRPKQEFAGFLVRAVMLAACVGILFSWKEKIYESVDYYGNDQVAATWHHYFLMGVNEETTGGYYADDVYLFGQFETREERNAYELETAFERINERGFWGSLSFYLKKMVMTFNDGTFSWGKEGNFMGDVPAYASPDTDQWTVFLRNVFWPDYKYSGRFNTYSQLIWLFILCCGMGMIFMKDRQPQQLAVMLALTGLFLFQMLFETRARYLLCYYPVFVLAAALGIDQYCRMISAGVSRLAGSEKSDKTTGCECRSAENFNVTEE